MPASKKGKLFKEEAPIPKHPGGVNPHTGERGGPGGLEPTRYGDWERKEHRMFNSRDLVNLSF